MALVFRDTILTNKGFEISNKSALGKAQFSIFKAVSTDIDLTNYKIEDLKNLPNLPNEMTSGSLVDYDSPQNSISVIKINFDNSKFKDGYTVRAVGLYGKDSDGNEFLHSLSVSENPIIIPQVTNNVFDGLNHSITIFSGNNKNMSVNLVQSGYATVHYVDVALSKIDLSKYETTADAKQAHEQLSKKIDNIDLSPYEKTVDANAAHEELKATVKQDIQPKLDGKANTSDMKIADQKLQGQINGKQPIGDYATNQYVSGAITQADTNAKGYAQSVQTNLDHKIMFFNSDADAQNANADPDTILIVRSDD